MAVLILDLCENAVKAGLFDSRMLKPLSFHMVQIQGQEREDLKKALVSIKDLLAGEGYRRFDKVLAGVRADLLSIRILTVPFDDKKKVDEVLPFELGDLLSEDVERTVAGAMPLDSGRVLAAAIDREVLGGYIEVLEEVDMDPFWIGSAVFSMAELLREFSDDRAGAALVTPDSITVLAGERPVFLKPFKDIHGLALSLAYLQEENIAVHTFFSLGMEVSQLKRLVKGADVVEATLPDGVPLEYAGVYALSLHLKKGLSGSINFRKGEFGYTKERARLKKGLTVTGVLIAIIVSIILSDIYIRYMAMAGEFHMYRDTLRERYRKLFPDEKKVVDELYLLEAKLKRADEELDIMGRDMSILDIMKALSRVGEKGAGMDVEFHEMTAGEGRVIVKGEARSFEEANRLKEVLSTEPLFENVLVTDAEAGAGGRTRFSLSITLKKRFDE